MSLKPFSASASAGDSAFASESPSAKFSLNINAFNGNTTNFNRCAAPKPKAMLTTVPVQPRELPLPSFGSGTRFPAGAIRPM